MILVPPSGCESTCSGGFVSAHFLTIKLLAKLAKALTRPGHSAQCWTGTVCEPWHGQAAVRRGTLQDDNPDLPFTLVSMEDGGLQT